MSEFKDDTFLSRWINDELSDEELTSFKKTEDYHIYDKILKGSKLIDSASVDEQSILKKIKAGRNLHIGRSQPTRKIWTYATAASVVLLLGFAIYSIFLTSDLTSYQTQVGQKMDIVLPDGSEVVLNANSSLSFNSDNWEENRELDLHGEGFFKVMKGSKFSVHTENGDVTVLGTQFTVKELGDYFEVMCFEGSVGVFSGGEEETLKPKTSVRKTRGTSFLRSRILQNQPALLSNRSSFTSIDMRYVLLDLENQYGIQFEGQEYVEDLSYTGSFPHDNLTSALKLVLGSININYEKKGNVVVLNN